MNQPEPPGSIAGRSARLRRVSTGIGRASGSQNLSRNIASLPTAGSWGVLAIEDEMRPESAEAIDRILAIGLKVAAITGEAQVVADSVAHRGEGEASGSPGFSAARR